MQEEYTPDTLTELKNTVIKKQQYIDELKGKINENERMIKLLSDKIAAYEKSAAQPQYKYLIEEPITEETPKVWEYIVAAIVIVFCWGIIIIVISKVG